MKFHSAFERAAARVIYRDVSEPLSVTQCTLSRLPRVTGLGHLEADNYEEERLGHDAV